MYLFTNLRSVFEDVAWTILFYSKKDQKGAITVITNQAEYQKGMHNYAW
jgi:hypothetical protein